MGVVSATTIIRRGVHRKRRAVAACPHPQRRFAIPLQIGKRIVHIRTMLFEESMIFHARLESQQPPNLRLRQTLRPVAFGC